LSKLQSSFFEIIDYFCVNFYIVVSNKNICSYRIERAIQIYILKNINLRNDILAYKNIIRAVDIHRKAMTLVYTHYVIYSIIYV